MEKLNDKPYKVILAALDLSEMDEHVIRYTAMISKVLPVERIFFVHIAKDLELPDELLKRYPTLLAPLDESIETDLRKKINGHFDGSEIEVNCIVKEGNAIDKILKLSRVKNVDLILMGRKKNLKGSGIVSSRIARKCPCSLLMVTEEFKPEINKVMVSVDFSNHSKLAMKQAVRLAESAKSEILVFHIFKVPTGYYKTGKDYNQFAEIMKNHAEKDCKKFLAKHHLPPDISCKHILTTDGNHAELIYSHAKETGTDLTIVGSKGRTQASSILIGSLAEKLVYKDSDIPILIVKNKGENMNFLDALMKI